MRKFLLLLISLGLFLGWGVSAHAAPGAEADLYPADASAFPTISTFLDVFDVTGRFVSGLKPEQVTVLEDHHPQQVKALNEMVVPLQLVVAINPGPSFGVRDPQGRGRFDYVRDALHKWAQALPANTPDDMSLVTITGPIIAHASAKDWLVSLDTFQPDFHATTPNLQSLQIALDTVSVAGPRIGMKRAVLFITPHMDDPALENTLQPLLDKAAQNRIRVFVWFTDTGTYAATTSASLFNQLAVQTRGAYFSAADTAPSFPDPESYFAPLRRIYSLQYISPAKNGGSHTVGVDVRGQSGDITSNPQTFTIDLQPPNPMFVSPVLQITRQAPEGDPYNQHLLPDKQQVSVLIEFPDGHQRSLVRTTLYVDGQIAAENKKAPFDTFTWDLSGYKDSGEHKLTVEAVDDLNQSKMSMEVPVTVTVIQPPHGVSAIFGRYRQPITYGSIGFAGLILVLIVSVGPVRMRFVRHRAELTAHADPLTQPVMIAMEHPNGRNGKANGNGKHPTASAPPEAPARLQRLVSDPLAAPGETLKAAPVSPILLSEKDMTFGTDPVQSMYILDDPSLAPRHARIAQSEDGEFVVADAGTIAGTWVNFEPVGKEGHALHHGDVVHFGQLIYRFELKDPPPPAEPKIEKEEA